MHTTRYANRPHEHTNERHTTQRRQHPHNDKLPVHQFTPFWATKGCFLLSHASFRTRCLYIIIAGTFYLLIAQSEIEPHVLHVQKDAYSSSPDTSSRVPISNDLRTYLQLRSQAGQAFNINDLTVHHFGPKRFQLHYDCTIQQRIRPRQPMER